MPLDFSPPGLKDLGKRSRNPVLELDIAEDLHALPKDVRDRIANIFTEIAKQANIDAENSWQRRKGPMGLYWRLVSTYARHLSRALRFDDYEETSNGKVKISSRRRHTS